MAYHMAHSIPLYLLLLLSHGFVLLNGRRLTVPAGKVSENSYEYEAKYMEQPLDHFSFSSNVTFSQRYLINDMYWDKEEGGPIFFYCGNEGDITWFANNTGFMWDIAPKFNAMVVFAEHRYYGNTLPFGAESYANLSTLGYLTSEQALADFVVLIKNLKDSYGDCPVVAFGGSYGGMLSAWLRMKYPSVVVGSIAASAPIWQFPGLCDCGKAYQIISTTMKGYSTVCFYNVLGSWGAIGKIASSSGGLSLLSTIFSLCEPLKNAATLTSWLEDVWFNLAMVNYPYPADFLEPLPAWPFNVTCQLLSQSHSSTDDGNNDVELLQALASAVQVYYNYTGQSSCLNLSVDSSLDLGANGWSYQACTEMIMPMCSNGDDDDAFPKQLWSLDDYIKNCQESYPGVQPRPFWAEELYNGKNISAFSNIVFSNGELDPWSGCGVLEDVSDSLIAVIIKDGAHHLDLRASNDKDTDSVKAARETHKESIAKWLMDYYSKDGRLRQGVL